MKDELRKGIIHIPQEIEVGTLDSDIFEPTYMKVHRKWSSSDYLLWLVFNPTCALGCRYCHESSGSLNRWLTAYDMQERLDLINPDATFDIIPSMSDPFLCPDIENILRFTKSKNHTLILFTYFPKQVRLEKVERILHDYPNVTISYSMHGSCDEERCNLLPNPHKIADVLRIINKQRALLNRIYIFSFLIKEQNVTQWERVFDNVDRRNVQVCSQPFIDYPNSRIYNSKPPEILKMRQVIPNLEFLEFMYRRKFEYELLSV